MIYKLLDEPYWEELESIFDEFLEEEEIIGKVFKPVEGFDLEQNITLAFEEFLNNRACNSFNAPNKQWKTQFAKFATETRENLIFQFKENLPLLKKVLLKKIYEYNLHRATVIISSGMGYVSYLDRTPTGYELKLRKEFCENQIKDLKRENNLNILWLECINVLKRNEMFL